jgi:D-arabinose 1-dehydrogenase-like Zn-dependent alcohol dehydrogenase
MLSTLCSPKAVHASLVPPLHFPFVHTGQEVKSQMFMENGCLIGASHLGSRKEMLAMLKLAADHAIKPWVETVEISESDLANAGMFS